MNDREAPFRAVVVGSSGGIGAAFVRCLTEDDVDVAALSRSGSGESRIDIEHEASISAAAARLSAGAPVRLVIVATGVLHDATMQPEKTYRQLDADNLARSFRVNAIGPALIAKHFLPLLPKSGRSFFGVISARVGSIEDNRLGGWYGYRAAKAALNQFVRTAAIELARQKPEAICVALHPGTVETRLSEPFRSGAPSRNLLRPDDSARLMLTVLDGLTPADTGHLIAWDGSRIPF
jgi:NAD(P)-dependent dehydrogenase (short-subunit alcohol dehydrogenase family)